MCMQCRKFWGCSCSTAEKRCSLDLTSSSAWGQGAARKQVYEKVFSVGGKGHEDVKRAGKSGLQVVSEGIY